MATNYLNRLKSIFNITTGSLPDSDKKILVPAEHTSAGNLKKLKFTDELLQLFKYWLFDTHDTAQTLKDRRDRYKALEYAYYNNTIFSKAVNLYAEETVQEDQQSETIDVDAPQRKVVTYIEDFFNTHGITQERIKDVAFNLALYADSFWIGVVSKNGENGYEDVIPVSVWDIEERLEFNAASQLKKKNQTGQYQTFVQNDDRLQALDNIVTAMGNNDVAAMFKTFLFGFQLTSNQFLPPWGVFHFRIFSSQSEFAPFGRPLMINSVAPFRQLQSAKNLMALARATGFPIKVFEVLADDSLDPMSKWEIVNEAREQFSNLGNETVGKEQFTMDSEVWVPQGLINFSTFESRINLDQIADVEMLRDDLIMGTDIPKGYLIVDRGAFGTSAQSLLAQHKPFARKVYNIQQAILKTIADMIRLQFVISGQYEYDTAFELSMPYPSVEESSDRLRIKSDTLRLAKDVVDNLGEVLGLERGEALPIEIVKQVFTKLSFLDGEDIDDWVAMVTDSRDSEENQLSERSRNRIEERLTTPLVKEVYFRSKRRMNMREGIIGQRHFYSSFNLGSNEKMLLDILKKDRKGRITG